MTKLVQDEEVVVGLRGPDVDGVVGGAPEKQGVIDEA